MSPPPSLVSPRYKEAIDSATECANIMQNWHRQDCRVVRSYEEFLRARSRMQARIAASQAIASLRAAALYPSLLEVWLERHRDANRDASWGRYWAEAEREQAPPGWGAGWEKAAPPGVRDPEWDGISLVPKTPGKKKRRRQRAMARREELRLEQAEFVRELRRQSEAASAQSDMAFVREQQRFLAQSRISGCEGGWGGYVDM
ncbi:hypothetical protein C8R46DRAFT_1214016 [Mycena filopes]|nr:hypothetical protein C8R46DRAFT_1214016 [Mycena filopes]